MQAANQIATRGYEEAAKGNYKAAIDWFTAALTFDSSDYATLINRSLCHFHLNHFEDAAQDAERAAMVNPLNAKAYYFLGRALMSLNKMSQAEKALTKAAELMPADSISALNEIQSAINRIRHSSTSNNGRANSYSTSSSTCSDSTFDLIGSTCSDSGHSSPCDGFLTTNPRANDQSTIPSLFTRLTTASAIDSKWPQVSMSSGSSSAFDSGLSSAFASNGGSFSNYPSSILPSLESLLSLKSNSIWSSATPIDDSPLSWSHSHKSFSLFDPKTASSSINGHQWSNNTIDVKPEPKFQQQQQQQVLNPTATNCDFGRVQNILHFTAILADFVSPHASDESIRAIFSVYGPVVSVDLKPVLGNVSTFACIEFADAESPQNAVTDAINNPIFKEGINFDLKQPLSVKFTPGAQQRRSLSSGIQARSWAKEVIERSGECFEWRFNSSCTLGNLCNRKHIVRHRQIDSLKSFTL